MKSTFRFRWSLAESFESNSRSKSRDEMWIFGCSFTYGWSLNDEDTFPWLLQEQYPDYEVIKFGVNGYGTVQSLKQLQWALRKSKPTLVVLVYSDIHDERNTFLRNRIKALAPWNRLSSSREVYQQPYARLESHGELVYTTGTVEYVPFPFIRYSALVHVPEQRYNALEEHIVQSHEVSKQLVTNMADQARSEGATFAIAGIHGGSKIEICWTMRKIRELQARTSLSIWERRKIPIARMTRIPARLPIEPMRVSSPTLLIRSCPDERERKNGQILSFG